MFAYKKKYQKSKIPKSIKITRDFINEAKSDFFKNGGVVTKITEDDVRARKLGNLDFIDGHEAYEFLNGE